MKYVSLDLETTGLDPKNNQILQIAMVVEDTENLLPVTELPCFIAYVRHPIYSGNAYALKLNSNIFGILADKNNSIDEDVYESLDDALREAEEFLVNTVGVESIVVAGKNVAGFDLKFLPNWFASKFKHRVLDPGTLFFNPVIDKAPPDLLTCKKRAGIDTPVAHDAYEDALDVISVLRYGLNLRK